MDKIDILLIIIGLIGWLIALVLLLKRPAGYFRINHDDPEKDTYTLELLLPFGELDRHKSIKFKVIKD